MQYSALNQEELKQEYQHVKAQFEACKGKNLKLNMARGKPSKLQLDIANDVLLAVQSGEDCIVDGVDARNYGELSGLQCAKEYWADILDCKPSQVFVGGTSSLNFMFDIISRAFSHGLLHSERPWCKEETVKFLCPSPGYDRHFRITETFGAELIVVPMLSDGPDMDMVEELVKDQQKIYLKMVK